MAKKVRRAPKALAAIACASPITPFGSISESSIGTDTEGRRRTRALYELVEVVHPGAAAQRSPGYPACATGPSPSRRSS